MKAVALTGIRTLETLEAGRPEPGPGQVLVEVGLVGICGSDMHLYLHGDIGGIQAPRQWVAGHECMGSVVEIGPGADPELLGRRVAVEPHRYCGGCGACRKGLPNACVNDDFLGLPPRSGALAEYLSLDVTQVAPVSSRVSDEEAALLEPLAIARHAVNLVRPGPNDEVAIIGTGVLGTCVLIILKQLHGISPVCVDLLSDRLQRASRLGASAVIQAEQGNPGGSAQGVRDACSGIGADCLFECAGQPDTFRVCADAAAPGAHLGIIGIPPGPEMVLPASSTRRKALTMRMVRRSLKTLKPCLDAVETGRLSCRELVTHIFPAADAGAAFELVAGYRDNVLKAAIDMRL